MRQRRPLGPVAPLVALAAVFVLLLSACPGGGFTCDCIACGNAITLNVFDSDQNANGGDWTVVASLDGEQVNTNNCNPENRGGLNACGFGALQGVYEIAVEFRGVRKELVSRFAGRAGADCCTVCLPGTTTTVILDDDLAP
jgi:hypothetical protein